MLFVYGSLMPLRVLEEIRFWKMQEKEHTVVIRELVPALEPSFSQLLHDWESVFAQSEQAAGRWIEAVIRAPWPDHPQISASVRALARTAVEQSELWVRQLNAMLQQSAAVRSSPTAPVVLQHIIRESEYFLGILQTIITAPAAGGHVPDGRASSGTRGETGDEPADKPPPLAPAQIKALISSVPAAGKYPSEPLRIERPPIEDDPAEVLSATGEGVWSADLSDRAFVPIGGHTLPPLPYAYDALEPHIDAETMKLHHDKHHLSYVEGLNKAEKALAQARETGDYALIKHWERELAFHGAGHYLHTIFWNVMGPRGGGNPVGTVAAEINKAFGSIERFLCQFSAAAEKVEGGGWALLVWSPRSRRLEVLQAEKHQNLSQWDVIPLLVLDVWEHAYYLKYRTDRAAYVKSWWNVVNWRYVNERLAAAKKVKWQAY